MPGKVSPDDLLAHVFERTGTARDDETVLQGPADGEDAAAIALPECDETLVVSSDPISLAAESVGTLAVPVASNDVAASGADPRWLTAVIMLPGENESLEAITRDLDSAATEIGASIVGGHSEYVDQLERPLVSLTAIGTADSFVPTGGAEPGDTVLLTKAAGIEGTAILATDFGDEFAVEEGVVDSAATFLEEISVLPDSRAIRAWTSAMHDPTEGGVAAGLLEVARASDVRLEIDHEAVPIREETEQLCTAADVDPLRIFGSGALLATVPDAAVDDALEALAERGIDGAAIGTVRDGQPALEIGAETITEPVQDDLYPLWERVDTDE
ncbi:AIR synthase family protein [Natronorubrum daqingense]|uniref:Hydrogenase expression protein n=1 Tax=Natronorubrum daqingense TaxID=588898 RepID=A0A1N7C6B6_9EURY|nr:AIR synthase family protein [Natronorubrum daqingense]APX96755.1 hydrogenase expression protein [Natronorubrum daqingense]SIR58994.1 hydrogenase expression/formation protein HypE [Natronorubrum daqingense]